MKRLGSNVKFNGKVYEIFAIKTFPIEDSKDKVVYCLINEKKKIEVEEKDLKGG